MATNITGTSPKLTYKDFLHLANSNLGLDATLRALYSGGGVVSPLQMSTSVVNIAGTLQIGGTATGSAALLDVGTTANKIVQLDGTAKLPAVDGSQLTNLPGGGGGTHTLVSDQTISTQVNQVDFTSLTGDFLELHFYAETTTSKELVLTFNDIISNTYVYQDIAAYSSGSTVTADTTNLSIPLGKVGITEDNIHGIVRIYKNGVFGGTGGLTVEIMTQSNYYNIRGALVNRMAFNTSETSITKISIGCRGWIESATSTEYITAGKFKLLQID